MTPEPGRPRVFGIGLNKTGTSSLHEALTILGYRSLHWGGPPVDGWWSGPGRRATPALPTSTRTSTPSPTSSRSTGNFELVDQQYPGSRFVLTVRPVEEWLESRRRHVERNRVRKAAGEYDGVFLEVDLDGWRAEFDDHCAAVRSYFASRTDYLEIDLTERPSWTPLCELVGEPVPDQPYPWANRDLDQSG